eukprot:365206-Chlamydomonas_euryale.AAC.4
MQSFLKQYSLLLSRSYHAHTRNTQTHKHSLTAPLLLAELPVEAPAYPEVTPCTRWHHKHFPSPPIHTHTPRRLLTQNFLEQYQLAPEEVTALQGEDIGPPFFAALTRVRTIHANCRGLLRTHHQRAGLELMDMMATYQETAYERLCRCGCASVWAREAPIMAPIKFQWTHPRGSKHAWNLHSQARYWVRRLLKLHHTSK